MGCCPFKDLYSVEALSINQAIMHELLFSVDLCIANEVKIIRLVASLPKLARNRQLFLLSLFTSMFDRNASKFKLFYSLCVVI